MGDAKFKIVSQSLKHQLQFFTGLFWGRCIEKKIWAKTCVDWGNRYRASFLLRHTIERLSVPITDYFAVALACFSTNFIRFHVNFNLRIRQLLDCFSFRICKVRGTAARKLKRVQMILNEWCLGTALAWLGLTLETYQNNGLLQRLPKLPFPIFTETRVTSHFWWILSFLGQH